MSETDNPIPGDDENGERKDRDVFGFLWRWWDRLSGWNDWIQWLWSFLQTKAGVAAAVTAGGVATVGTVAIVQPDLLFRAPPQVATEAKSEKWSDDAVVFTIVGSDKSGREARFDVVILTNKYTWVRGSAEQIARDGIALTGADIQTQLFTDRLRAGLARSKDIIAVGTASEEGNSAVETNRAGQRARTLANWLKGATDTDTRLRALNLGQFDGRCAKAGETESTSWQRPVIMIGIRSQQADVTVAEALANAMSGKRNLPSPDCYSVFQLSDAN
ncbi:MAG: hypothetical protein AAF732_18610 [Pseudomonadota bacterium]